MGTAQDQKRRTIRGLKDRENLGDQCVVKLSQNKLSQCLVSLTEASWYGCSFVVDVDCAVFHVESVVEDIEGPGVCFTTQ